MNNLRKVFMRFVMSSLIMIEMGSAAYCDPMQIKTVKIGENDSIKYIVVGKGGLI